LKRAQEFSFKSNGVSDITVGRQLVKFGYLPKLHKQLAGSGGWEDIVLDDECGVRFRRPVIVDLGGIAKGLRLIVLLRI
jgi:thiamine biosynthesis lipoprotein